MNVSWSDYPREDDLLGPEIIQYNVYFSLADTPSDYMVVSVNASKASNAVFNDLGIFTLYTASVSAVNVGGEGPKSVAVKVRTMEGGELNIRRKLTSK